MGLKRELNGLLGSPNPFLIGWVRLGSINICGGFGNGNSKSYEKPTVFRCRYFSSAFDRSKAFFFFWWWFGLLYLFPKGIGGGIDFSVSELIFVGIKV